MSGISCGIYPLNASPSEQIVLDIIVENSVLLDQITTNEDQIAEALITTIPELEIEADAQNQALNTANGIIANFTYGGSMGNFVGYFNDTGIASVATPTTIMSIELTQLGTYLISYSFWVGTNTANGGSTPLTSCEVRFYLEGQILSDMPLVYYPQSAKSNKQTFDIAVSGIFPLLNSQYYPLATLELKVNIAPENSAYGTFCAGRTLNAVLVSPYLPP